MTPREWIGTAMLLAGLSAQTIAAWFLSPWIGGIVTGSWMVIFGLMILRLEGAKKYANSGQEEAE